jgi:hypothetical protein
MLRRGTAIGKLGRMAVAAGRAPERESGRGLRAEAEAAGRARRGADAVILAAQVSTTERSYTARPAATTPSGGPFHSTRASSTCAWRGAALR